MIISEDENSITLPNGIELVAEETDLKYPEKCNACYFEYPFCRSAPCDCGDRIDGRTVIYRIKP